MDDIELSEQKSSNDINDENFDEDLSAFYSGIPDTKSHEIDTNLDSSDNEENVNQPLIEKTQDLVQTKTRKENYEKDPVSPEQLENLLRNDGGSILDNIEQNEEEEQTELPKLNIKKKVKIYIILVIFGIFLYAIPNFFYGVEYNKMALAKNMITGKLHDKTFESGLHFFYPWYKLIEFDKTIQTIELNKTKIFTIDKLQVKIWINIFYKLDNNKLNKIFRKFGFNLESILKSVCHSEIQNIGQNFSIESYRTQRLKIQDLFRKQIKSRLEKDYFVHFFELYIFEIKFAKVFNNLNLLRMLNGIYKEKAEYQKITNLTVAETSRLVRSVKNEAKKIIENAKANANNLILKKANYDLNLKIEYIHLKYLNSSLDDLNFSKKSMNDTKKILSFCFLSSLINNQNIRFINTRNDVPTIGFSDESEKLIGILSI